MLHTLAKAVIFAMIYAVRDDPSTNSLAARLLLHVRKDA